MPTKKKQHDWSQFTLRIVIKVPPEKVFKAWTDDRLVSQWFTEKTVIEPRKGGRIYFEWLAGDKWETKVTAITKNRRFVFPFGPKGETVEVKLLKAGRHCVCELHQYGTKTTPKDKWNMHCGCIQGWTFFLANLKAFLEHGIDLRDHDPHRTYKQDYINC